MTTTKEIQEIEVELANKPGTLADVTEALADLSINVQGFTCTAQGDTGKACFVTDNPQGAIDALTDAGFSPQTHEAVFATAPNKPGQLANLSRRLAQSGINIDRSFVATDDTGELGIGFSVDDAQQARKVLEG